MPTSFLATRLLQRRTDDGPNVWAVACAGLARLRSRLNSRGAWIILATVTMRVVAAAMASSLLKSWSASLWCPVGWPASLCGLSGPSSWATIIIWLGSSAGGDRLAGELAGARIGLAASPAWLSSLLWGAGSGVCCVRSAVGIGRARGCLLLVSLDRTWFPLPSREPVAVADLGVLGLWSDSTNSGIVTGSNPGILAEDWILNSPHMGSLSRTARPGRRGI